MKKEQLKKMLAGVGIAGLVASIGLTTIQCGAKQEAQQAGDETQMEAQQGGAEKDTTAQASCGQEAAEKDTTAAGSCGQEG